MRSRVVLAFLVLILAAGGYACGPREVTAPPPEVLAAGDATNGALVFQARCANCHATTTEMRLGPGMAGLFGPNGPMRPPGVDYGPNLPNGMPITEANVAILIRAGVNADIAYMPPINLDDQQLADLIAYLRTLE